jgi:hypothetical protein
MGGRQERTWTWDGGAGLVSSGWKQTVPARPKGEVANVPRPSRGSAGFNFVHGRHGIYCSIRDGRRAGVFCQHPGYLNATGEVRAAGRVRTCTAPNGTQDCIAGNPGVADFPYELRPDESVVVGRFRCRATRAAIRCTRVKTGKGFEIGRRGARRIG